MEAIGRRLLQSSGSEISDDEVQAAASRLKDLRAVSDGMRVALALYAIRKLLRGCNVYLATLKRNSEEFSSCACGVLNLCSPKPLVSGRLADYNAILNSVNAGRHAQSAHVGSQGHAIHAQCYGTCCSTAEPYAYVGVRVPELSGRYAISLLHVYGITAN